MISRRYNACLLRPEDLDASHDDLEVVGAFNPGAIALDDGSVLLMVRVAERPREKRDGMTGLPRFDADAGLVIDWEPNDAIDFLDPRVVQYRGRDAIRLTFCSHIRLFRSEDGRRLELTESGRFLPESPYDEYGVEDPRITRIDDTYLITYVAVSRHGAGTAIATTRDFRSYERLGIAFPPENKDVVFLPEKVGGEFVALHRPNPATHFSPPEMWVARSPDLIHWGRHECIHAGAADWETGRIGAGPPPIAVGDGFLEMYHGNARPNEPGSVGRYSAGLILLDRSDPVRVLKRSREAVMVPEADFERYGFVPDVIFPTGIVPRDETALVYYGAADMNVGVVEFALDDLLNAME